MKIEDFKMGTKVKYLDVLGKVIYFDYVNGALMAEFESEVPYKGFDNKRTKWVFGGGGSNVDLTVLSIID